jgi:hypothetical protein
MMYTSLATPTLLIEPGTSHRLLQVLVLKLKPLPELLAQYLARRGLGDPVDEDHLADLLVVDHLEHTLG